MIVIYSGFWILYFQMFDTVLWYLRDYVSMAPVDSAVNALLSTLGLKPSFKFDVEHVTVINAGTIIALQLIIAFLVKKTRPLPTMIAGICLGVIGFLLLAISESPMTFIAGIVIFSVGEMTAHPKYISYVGQIAPEDKKATYMGYAFLYGVIGSSIGGVLGAKLYSHFVDALHRPRTLWLIFASIGVATVLGLVSYDRLVAKPVKN
jgi:MFS family permease